MTTTMPTTLITFQETLNYLTQNFFTLDQLAERTPLDRDKIRDLREAECIPGPSYQMASETTLKTFLFGTTHFSQPQTQEEFFHPSVIDWIRPAMALAQVHPLSEVGIKVRENFQKEFGEAFQELGGLDFGLQASQCWNQLLKGTYGVCVRHPSTVKAIVRKEMAVHRLEIYLQQNHPNLREAWNEFDQVVSPFSPHERHLSCRARLTPLVQAKLHLSPSLSCGCHT